jgi:hypothetical protein
MAGSMRNSSYLTADRPFACARRPSGNTTISTASDQVFLEDVGDMQATITDRLNNMCLGSTIHGRGVPLVLHTLRHNRPVGVE